MADALKRTASKKDVAVRRKLGEDGNGIGLLVETYAGSLRIEDDLRKPMWGNFRSLQGS